MTIEPQTYRPRTTVQALQWGGDNTEAIKEWVGDHLGGGSRFLLPDEITGTWHTPHLHNDSRNEWEPVNLGDWIIRGHRGAFFAWPGDEFDETYERVVPEDEQVASLEVQAAQLRLVREQHALAEDARHRAADADTDFVRARLEMAAAEHEARGLLAEAQAELSANARAFTQAASPASMPANIGPRPTLGTRVLFQEMKATCAAVVTHVYDGQGMVNLAVFSALGNTYPARFVRYADTLTAGHWSWAPER